MADFSKITHYQLGMSTQPGAVNYANGREMYHANGKVGYDGDPNAFVRWKDAMYAVITAERNCAEKQKAMKARVKQLEAALESVTGVVERQLKVMDKINVRSKTLRAKISTLADCLNKIDEANFNAINILKKKGNG